jgi:hypothetical protein
VTKTDTFHDQNVQAVADRMRSRARVGLRKYGTDTTRADFDGAIYCEAAIRKLELPFVGGHPRSKVGAIAERCPSSRSQSFGATPPDGWAFHRCDLEAGHRFKHHVKAYDDGREFRWPRVSLESEERG